MANQNGDQNINESLKPFTDRKIAVLILDRQIKETLIQDLKFFGFKNLTVFRSKKELFAKLSTTDPQPDILFSDFDIMLYKKPSETGIYLLRTLHNFALKINLNIEMSIVMIARKIDKESAIECFSAGARDVFIFPTLRSVFGNKLFKWITTVTEKKAESEIGAYLKKGDEYFRKGEFEKAIRQYDIILAKFGQKADVLEKKGQALLASGNYEEALICFKKAVLLKNDFARAYQGIGDAHCKLMDYELARKNYRKVLEIEHDNCYAHFNIGETYKVESRWNEAEHVYKEGVEKNPKFILFRVGLAETYVSAKKINKAIDTYKDIIRLKPNNAQFSARLGDIYIKNRMYSQAEEILTQSIQKNSRAVILFNKLGIALRKQGKYQEAIKKYLQALKIDSTDPYIRYNIAKAYYENGEREEALKNFLLSAEIDPFLKDALLKDKEISELHKELARHLNLWVNLGSGKLRSK